MPRQGKPPALTSAEIFPAAICLLAIAVIALSAQNKPVANSSAAKAGLRMEASRIFESVCASCHGLDARGGERGPDIASRSEVVRKTDAELTKILTNGNAAEGMPSFASYGPAKLAALVAYLRVLQGRSKEAPLPGDPARGKALFFGKAKCGECHMLSGQGGFLAEDLTGFAARLSADEVRAVIVNPNKDLDPRRGLVTVVLADSTTLSGIARNEDNFSLQLQTSDGVFHLLSKSDVRSLTYAGRSPMPSDYGSTLSTEELNDLVSYLLRVSRSEKTKKAESNPKNDEEE